jgi:hypothetical protein
MAQKTPLLALACSILLFACGKESKHVFITSELNTSGVRHIVDYNNELAPSKIIYENFMGSGNKDTTGIDSLTKVDVDSIVYDFNNRNIKLVRLSSDGAAGKRDFRKYYFNSDNLLTRITRFSAKTEYTTDSVVYDYTRRQATYIDLTNKISYVLEYDAGDNITSCIQQKMSDGSALNSEYYYYDEFSNPFLVNFADEDLLFGCFNINSVGLLWNNGIRPAFSSRNNVQACKKIHAGEETNELYEYQYRDGMPLVQYGSTGVVYYRYLPLPSASGT